MRRQLAIAVLCLSAALGAAAQDRIKVAVIDYAGLPGQVVRPAIRQAEEVFRKAGVLATWVFCEDPEHGPRCTGPLPVPGQDLELLVMPHPPFRPLGRSLVRDMAGLAMGVASRPRAWVFYPVVEQYAQSTCREPSLVLANVMVHEAAHMLGLEHQRSGVMRGFLVEGDVDDLARGRAFTPREEEALRKGARRRMKAMGTR